MKTIVMAALSLLALLLMADPLFAQTAANTSFFGSPSSAAGFGAGIAIVGAGIGLGKIGAAALESMARQPEVAGRIFTGMLIIGAFLEGVTLFALVICIIMAGK